MMGILNWIFGRRPRPVPVPPGPPPAPVSLTTLYSFVNQARMRQGFAVLAADPRLEAVASRRIARLAMRGVLDHAGFAAEIEAAIPGAVAAGEVLAAGQTTPSQAMADWLRDPPHRAELLGDFTRMGAGVATGRGGMLYWCVDFARE